VRTDDYDTVIEGFGPLKAAVIDTSSIILCEKAGFLPLLASVIELRTISSVALEYTARGGVFPPRLAVTEHLPGPTDPAVLETALRMNLPLISEDRKLLLRADEAGLVYYNALVMLEFLLFKDAVGREGYKTHKISLSAEARYSPRVLAWAEGLHWSVVKRGPALCG
jgi:hypothetical protein